MSVYVDRHPEKRDRIRVISDYMDRHRIMAIPGSRYLKAEKVWTLPLTWSSCIVLRVVFQADLTIGDDLAEWAWRQKKERIDPCVDLRDRLEPYEGFFEEDTDLFPFQKAGVQYLSTSTRAILADPMGTGKTIQTIKTLEYLGEDAFPALVVAPNSVVRPWANEYKRWAPHRKVVPLVGGLAARRKALQQPFDVAVINWEGLRALTRLRPYAGHSASDKEKEPKEFQEIPWATVVADEAHRAKNPKAKCTWALWGVSENARHRFALTGTPVANRPNDLWSILHFIRPDEWPVQTKWVEFFLDTAFSPFGGYEIYGIRYDRKKPFADTIDPNMRRVPKEIVLPQLPDKVYTVLEVEMEAKQRKAYLQMQKTMIAQLESGELLAARNPLSRLTRLMQMASATAVEDAGEGLKLGAPSCKVKALMDLLEDSGEEQRLVVFAVHKGLVYLAARELDKAGITYGLVTGDQTPEERQEHVDTFQRGDTKVILCTLATGGTGITLTRADTVVFMQTSWSLVERRQAEDRVHRIGSEVHESINVIDLVAVDTVEEHQRELMSDKDHRFEEVVRDKTTLAKLLGAAK